MDADSYAKLWYVHRLAYNHRVFYSHFYPLLCIIVIRNGTSKLLFRKLFELKRNHTQWKLPQKTRKEHLCEIAAAGTTRGKMGKTTLVNSENVWYFGFLNQFLFWIVANSHIYKCTHIHCPYSMHKSIIILLQTLIGAAFLLCEYDQNRYHKSFRYIDTLVHCHIGTYTFIRTNSWKSHCVLMHHQTEPAIFSDFFMSPVFCFFWQKSIDANRIHVFDAVQSRENVFY